MGEAWSLPLSSNDKTISDPITMWFSNFVAKIHTYSAEPTFDEVIDELVTNQKFLKEVDRNHIDLLKNIDKRKTLRKINEKLS